MQPFIAARADATEPTEDAFDAALAAAFIPLDRRCALAAGRPLPATAMGAVLFADLSGFTPLTEAFVRTYGPVRGAEETTRSLNLVYARLVEILHAYGACVVGFSGDGMTCWFDALRFGPGEGLKQPTLTALRCAQALHAALGELGAVNVNGATITLGLKVAVSAGRVSRIAVGDPAYHCIDVIAGAPVDAVGRLEQQAKPGETVIDGATAALLTDSATLHWRAAQSTDAAAVADAASVGVIQRLQPAARAAVVTWDQPSDLPTLPQEAIYPWLQPAVYARLQTGGDQFLAELRPAVALFLRFSGLRFEQNPHAPAQLDRFIRWAQAILHRYEGTLIQVTTGDKGSYLYAAFGAPVAHDNDAVRAVAAALALRRSPADLDFAPQVQLGIAQGRMRVGPYGGHGRRTYGVQGPAANLAARLMMHAQAGEIVLDATVAAGARGIFHVEARGEISLKGVRQTQTVYTVTEQAATAPIMPAAHAAAQLIGRDAEMAQLLALLHGAKDGRGALARIEAEAGLGKSRLLEAFARQARAEQIFLAVATCQITTRDTAYAAARQIGRQLLGLDQPELADDDARVAQVATLLQQIDPTLLPRMPLLSEALGLPIPDNALTAKLDPQLRREALLALTLEMIQQLAQLQPIVILAEDIHWLDEASAELLATLVRAGEKTPLLVVATQRPPTSQTAALLNELTALPNQTFIRLAELTEVELTTLAMARLRAPLDALALDFVQAQAQGNPFFIEELLDSLRENGDLVSTHIANGDRAPDDATAGAQWRLAPHFVAQLQAADCLEAAEDGWRLKPRINLSAAAIGIPDSIHGIVLARLDRLPDAVQLTVKTASVIGRVFELDVLQRAHPQRISQATLAQHLAMLAQRDFARIERSEPQPVYFFKHNITQEVAYQTLLDRQRRGLHQTVGETLESLQPHAIERLALHFYYADTDDHHVREKSLGYLDAAAQRAKHDYANQIALNYLTRALKLQSSWPRRRAQVELLHILGRRAEEVQALRTLALEAEDAGAEGEAAEWPIETQLLWSAYYDAVSDYDQAEAVVMRALKASRAQGNVRAAARCHARLGLIAWRLGDYGAARRHYGDGLAELEAVTAPDAPRSQQATQQEEAEIRYGLGLVLRQQGHYAAAIAEFERSLALHRAAANRIGEAQALKAIGLAEKYRQNFAAAQIFYTQALALYRLVGAQAGESETLLNMAEVRSLEGAHDLAKELLGRALLIQQTLNNQWWQLRILNGLGIVDMSTGNFEQALAWLEQGLGLAEKLGDESGQAYLLCNLGQTLTHLGRHADAAATLQQGYALAAAQADTNLQGLMQTELGILALAQDEPAKAEQAAVAAIDCFRTLGLEAAAATDLATLALAQLARGDADAARAAVAAFSAIPADELLRSGDYPQRNYFACYQVLHALGEVEQAEAMLDQASRIMLERAHKLATPATQQAYLDNVACNRAIRAAMAGNSGENSPAVDAGGS